MKTETQTNLGNWYEPDCPYAGRCKSKGSKCGSCRHNRADEDHYEPKKPYHWGPQWEPIPYRPTITPNPWPNRRQPIWC